MFSSRIAAVGLTCAIVVASVNSGSAALIGCYALNETNNPSLNTIVADSSGNGRNGVMGADGSAPVGAVEGVASADAGLYGTAFSFSSAPADKDYVDINPLAGTLIGRDSALSYALWVKPSSTQNVATPTMIATPGSSFDFRLTPSGSNWLLRLQSGNTAGTFLLSTATIPSDVWTHIAVTKDANGSAGTNLANVKFYINGALVNSGTIGRAGTGNAARFFLGTSAIDQYYNGGLDEVYIYNEVIDAATIANLAVVPEPSAMVCALMSVMVCAGTSRRRSSRN